MNHLTRFHHICVVLSICCHGALSFAQSTPAVSDSDTMLQLLQKMVDEDPTRSDSYRLIGRIHKQNDRTQQARDSFEKALEIQPDNVAAHSDLGELLSEIGVPAIADYHFDQVMELAPQSSYAEDLVKKGLRGATQLQMDDSRKSVVGDAVFYRDEEASSGVDTVGFEIQTFDGSDDLKQRLNQITSDAEALPFPNRIRAFIELGTLYNTNVSLTPISRELTGNEAASAQLFFSPDVEWIAIRRGDWRAGPLARGYFTVNEGNFRALNLASIQPGVFIERDFHKGDNDFIGRLEYVYSLDTLDGDRFGDRHSVKASLTSVLPSNDVVYSYLTTSYSNFANDGINPQVDSLDGPTISIGASRFNQTDWDLMPQWSIGADLERADTDGADFRYSAINFHTDTTFRVAESVSFIPSFGIGFRDYSDFTGLVNRDELTWRLGARLKWQCREHLAISAIVGHDRFASDNEQFDTQRTQAGVVLTLTR